MLLSMGGQLTRGLCDSSGEEEAKPPDVIIKMLTEFGEHGIVVDGIIAWVAMNREMTAENIIKQLMGKSLSLGEMLKSRETLRASGGPELVKWFEEKPKTRTERKGAVEDIVDAMTFLSESKKMPFILAGPEQLRRCPGAGSSSQTVPVQELETKIESLEKCMTDFMDYNKKQIEALTAEVKKTVETRKTPEVPEITIHSPAPGKKRKTSEITVEAEVYNTPAGGMAHARPSFSQVAMTGVLPIQPLGRKSSSSHPVTTQMMKTAIENAFISQEKSKNKQKGRNVFRGNAAEAEASSLAADVDLVASGVAKDARIKQMKDFLIAKGIDVMNVESLTKPELITEGKVRSQTMKVTVKATHLEKAMDPSMWPYRVGVRHYRAPQRSRQGAGDGSWASQSAQSGGRIEDRDSQSSVGSGGRGQQQNRRYGNPARGQKQVYQPALETHNRFGSLGEQLAP